MRYGILLLLLLGVGCKDTEKCPVVADTRCHGNLAEICLSDGTWGHLRIVT